MKSLLWKAVDADKMKIFSVLTNLMKSTSFVLFGNADPPFPNRIFFTTCLSLKFSHLQDRLLLLNWLTCFLMESHSILPLI